jgi:hypothetical protein
LSVIFDADALAEESKTSPEDAKLPAEMPRPMALPKRNLGLLLFVKIGFACAEFRGPPKACAMMQGDRT